VRRAHDDADVGEQPADALEHPLTLDRARLALAGEDREEHGEREHEQDRVRLARRAEGGQQADAPARPGAWQVDDVYADPWKAR